MQNKFSKYGASLYFGNNIFHNLMFKKFRLTTNGMAFLWEHNVLNAIREHTANFYSNLGNLLLLALSQIPGYMESWSFPKPIQHNVFIQNICRKPEVLKSIVHVP